MTDLMSDVQVRCLKADATVYAESNSVGYQNFYLPDRLLTFTIKLPCNWVN